MKSATPKQFLEAIRSKMDRALGSTYVADSTWRAVYEAYSELPDLQECEA